jgi:protein-tyrosine phosphatase
VSAWFLTYGFADVLDDLLIGAYPLDEDDVAMLSRMGVRRILNLSEDREYGPGERQRVQSALAAAGIEERRVALTDYGGLPPEKLEALAHQLSEWLDSGVRTYLHCRAGWQRSPAVAAAVIAVRDSMDIDEAMAQVQSRKPSADPLPEQREDLRRWWRSREPTPRPAAGELGGA